jgi:hypothetical protein
VATDAERISTLLRQGFSADAIAALLDTDLATVHDVQVGDGELPASGGGGSGLVVGTWETREDLPSTLDGDGYDLAGVEGASELEFQWVGQPSASGGFSITDADTSEEYGFDMQSFGDWTPLMTIRCIVPPGADVHIQPMFGATDSFVSQRLRRRTLS